MSKKILGILVITILLVIIGGVCSVKAANVKEYQYTVQKDKKGVKYLYIAGTVGDLSGDKKIGAEDLRLASKMMMGSQKPTDLQKRNGDLNQNGKIDASDLRLIQRRLAGKIEKPDLDGNGKVTAADARIVMRLVAGEVNSKVKLTTMQAFLADMNADGKITNEDASLILKYSVGLIK